MTRLLQFPDAGALRDALATLRAAGRGDVRWHAPLPIADDDDLHAPIAPCSIPRAALVGGCLFGAGGWLLQFYAAVVDYPIDVGARPPDSALAFLPAAMEMAVLGAALATIGAFLVRASLPRFHQPLFDVPAFGRTSLDGFFLLVPDDVDASALHPSAVHEVPRA